MRKRFLVFLSVFLSFYVGSHLYIGTRFFPLASALLGPATILYWILLFMAGSSAFVARMRRGHLTGLVTSKAVSLGNYWLVVLFYGSMLWGVLDLWAALFPPWALGKVAGGVSVVAALAVIFILGRRRARHIHIAHHEIAIDKVAPGLTRLRAVLVSDLHLGTPVNNARLGEMVEEIVKHNPDIVFFAGDIIDGDVTAFAATEMPGILRRLQPRFGCFAVLGNHEYIGGDPDVATRHLEAAGISALVDRASLVEQSFYVVGRNDYYASYRGSATGRGALASIMSAVDTAKPVILLDHQPVALAEARQSGADLMLSGHTHHGQFFPLGLITRRIFAVDWGYLRQDQLQIVVSCGFGTWGAPLRTSGYSEIVVVDITFKEA